MTSLTEPIGSIPRPPGGPFCYERYCLLLGAHEVQIDTASAKIRARVLGTALAAEELGV